MARTRTLRWPALRAYLEEHEGQVFTVNQITKDLGWDRAVVLKTMNSRTYYHPDQIEIVERGYSWKWKGGKSNNSAAKSSDERIFEVVGEFKDGSLLLRCEDGLLFKAQPL